MNNQKSREENFIEESEKYLVCQKGILDIKKQISLMESELESAETRRVQIIDTLKHFVGCNVTRRIAKVSELEMLTIEYVDKNNVKINIDEFK